MNYELNIQLESAIAVLTRRAARELEALKTQIEEQPELSASDCRSLGSLLQRMGETRASLEELRELTSYAKK